MHHVGLALGYRGDVGYLPAFLVEPEDLALEGFFTVDVSRFLHSCDKLVDTNRNWSLNCIIMMILGQKAPLSCIFSWKKAVGKWLILLILLICGLFMLAYNADD